MSLSYRNMLAFIRVAESSTFAEAAEKLHLTQPALSSSIKKMEEQLGGDLFSRSTRRVALTPEGSTLLPFAKRLVNEWDEIYHDMQRLFAMKQGKLSIAAMPSFAESYLPELVRHFHDDFPNIRLRIWDVVMEETLKAILNGDAEIGFIFEPERQEGIEFVPLFNDHFVAVLFPEHPLAKKRQISLSALLQFPFIAMNRGAAVRRWTEDIASKEGAPNIIAETGQLGTLGQLISMKMGVSIVPSLCITQMKERGLVCLPLTGSPLSKRVGMIRLRRGSVSVAAEHFWTMCMTKMTSDAHHSTDS